MYSSALKPFVFNASDLAYILSQINFRPLFDAAGNAIINWNGTGAIFDGDGNQIWDGYSDLLDANGATLWDNVDGDDVLTADEIAAAALVALELFGPSYPSATSSYGLRDVTGLNNNLNLINSTYGTVDQPFLRTVAAQYTENSHGHVYVAEEAGFETGVDQNGVATTGVAYWANNAFANAFGGNTGFASTGLGSATTNYSITQDLTDPDNPVIVMDNVVDYTPRMISLLTTTGGVEFLRDGNGHIVDTNGAATIASWGMLGAGYGIQDAQARFDGTAGQFWVPETTVGDVTTPAHWENEYFIGAQNPGVSPTNGWFTIFGQFFDHGLDFIDKGAQGKTIKIAFAADDPLYGVTGSDGRPATSITISRANVAGFDADGNPEYLNHTSPFIDQSQTYGSDAAVTEFLREWVLDPVTGTFKAGMNMLNGHTLAEAWTKPDGTLTHETLPTLNELRAHAVATGRDDISWNDVFNFHNSGQALILDMNPRFDAANLLSSTGFNDANHNGTQDIGEDTYVGFNDLNGNGIQDGAETTQAQDVLDAIAYLGNVANGAIRAGDSFGLVGDDLTLVLGSSLPVDDNPMHDIPAGTYTGANAMMLWVNFANMSVMSTSAIDYLPTTEAVASAVGTLLLASVGDHYIAGDGRVNENFGLTTVHHVFHEEHNFQIENLKNTIYKEADARNGAMADGQYDAEYMKDFQNWDAAGVGWNAATGNWETNDGLGGGEIAWNLDVMFNAAKLTVEMEYQHVAIDQYARTVTPDIKEFVGYTNSENPTVSLEYAQSIFRFGHSQLRETIDTIDPTHGLTGKITGYALKLAFLNPDEYADLGPAAIALGMTHQQGNEIDEFITPALNQGLLGLPLDLAAINIARGRDVGIPALNEFRTAVGLEAYTGWADFGANMGHPDNLVNFIAAYSFDGDVGKAAAVMALNEGNYADTAEAVSLALSLGLVQDAMTDAEFEAYASDYAFNFMNGGDRGVDMIDTWLGGLAEVHVTGGLLGETFNLVFVDQMERLQDGDRFYYLYRLVNQQFADEIAGGQFKDIIERNTGLTHMGGSAFSYNDQYYDLGATRDDTNTVNNNHKYGDLINVVGNTKGIYSDGGNTQSRDGQTINVRITDPVTGVVTNKQFIRDTRVTDPNAPNGGLGIDGTDNSGAESTEVIVGTKYDDFIYARGGDDTVYGDGGNDIIYGGNGIDRLYGGDGKDRIIGGDGAELADGGAGDDYIAGDSSATAAAGVDQLMGGMGNDEIHGGIGIDKLAGGGGDDRIYGEGETDPFTHGGDGNDFIDGGITGDNLYGDNGDDVIVGGADQDILYGGNGDDILRPGNPSQALGGGPDEVLGGDGITDTGYDMIDFSDNVASANGIAFDLQNQANPQVQIDGTTPVPASTQIEAVTGSVSNDTLTGDANDNWLIGGTGSDKFTGGAGDDIIIGGSMRLDEVIGKYQTAYTHNNNNDNANNLKAELRELFDVNGDAIAVWDGNGAIYSAAGAQLWDGIFDVDTPDAAAAIDQFAYYTQEEMDWLYQGASNRVAWNDALDNSGLIDAANAQLGGADYEKHFTEMLRTKLFQDIKLGDGGSDAGKTDTLILAGNRADYLVAEVTYAGHSVVRLTGIGAQAGQGSDLVADVENFRFEDGTVDFATLVVRPGMSVDDISVAEGDAGVTTATFRVSLDFAVGTDVTVDWASVAGTAAAGSDFTGAAGTVTIPAGQTFVDVTIDVAGETLFENDEQFSINLSNASYGIAIADASGTATIVNDDTAPSMAVSNVVIAEDGGSAEVTVELTEIAGRPIAINFATAIGTAVSPDDFDATSGTLVFAPGVAAMTVTVPIVNDNTYEGSEDFTVALTSSDTFNASLNATVTITPDGDVPPVVSISDAVAVSEGAGAVLEFTVSLSEASGLPVTVDYATADGSAAAPGDYAGSTGTLVFAPGETTKTISITVADDAVYEAAPESVSVNLTAVVGATLGAVTASGSINDNDPMPTMAVSDVNLVEGDAGTTNAMLTVTLSGVSATDTVIDWATAGGTATDGVDFVGATGSLTIAAGDTTATITIPVNGDTLYENDESLAVNLSSANTANAVASATVTIANDDAKPALTVDSVNVDEGGVATITVSIDAAAGKDIVVNYAAVDGTAISPDDYTLAAGSLTIPAGSTTATLVVNAAQDTLFEGVETYSVNFTSADTSNTAASTASIQIDVTDPMPQVSISDPVAVTEGGVPSLVFTVSLDSASGVPVTLDFATADGTAIAGADYSAASGSLTFAPGETVKTITVPLLDDTLYEPTAETLAVNLSNVVGANVADGAAEGTINDNDPMPTLSVSGATVAEGNVGATNLVFTVSLSGASAAAVTVDFATADGTATIANNDYQSQSGSLTFAPGETSKTVTVLVNGDMQLETNETVALALSNAVGAAIGAASDATVTNDDSFNLVNGTVGPDSLVGSTNPDNMTGLAGNDVLFGSAGADILNGGTDVDTANYSAATGAVYANLGANFVRETALTAGTATTGTPAVTTDTLASIENVVGTAFGDRLVGSTGNNVFTPGSGADIILGQGGSDTVNYADRTAGAIYANLQGPTVRETNLTVGTATTGTAAVSTDQLTGINNVVGTGFGDLIVGNNSANNFQGGGGNDNIQGNGGNDIIDGGDGADSINAGSGDDVIRQASTGGRDFVNGSTNGLTGDTFELVGSSDAENFVIYTRTAAIAAGFGAGLNAATQIVVTRQVGAGAEAVISELTGIEEIKVLTSSDPISALAGSNANNPTPGSTTNVAASGDSIRVVGDFTTTSLRYNTITVEGSAANDTVDISALTSAHRVVFNTNGGGDAVIGDMRPQDVVTGSLLASDLGSFATDLFKSQPAGEEAVLEMGLALAGGLLGNRGAAADWAVREANMSFGDRFERGRQLFDEDGNWLKGAALVAQKPALLDIADELAPLIRQGSSNLAAGLGSDALPFAHSAEQTHLVKFQDEDSWAFHRNGNHHENLF
ncbi:MAG: Calx-beta domain-containing protein [Sphingorhabdus sp.]|uniref:Calx-beta domain-containing protein n=1 Tax=Sphingorhabdus sp. TaxID=1902408 RepID=UPI003C9EB7B7